LFVACCYGVDEAIRTTFIDFSRGIMIKLAKRFLIEDRGVTAIEYALIAGLIAAAIATMVGNIGTNINSVFTAVAAAIKT
jgi:pilus assembly protein Flp/PilA